MSIASRPGPAIVRRTPEREGIRLSVVMPAHRATGVLPRSFAALAASDLDRSAWELIV